ncbi:FMN-dependent NADPH-azoreductase [Variovorax sp. SRS16]|uniref:NADPH-dependent FMN reductase n=1 Tax=Variovorax sp. SRS16 TaxID=282217 RepID=UPI001315BA90|nr:NAD(P)H-dependent oxidoreductase [Variovorax sp. SRS16]VTU30790.1 FMN-dependent NADPH-azoreductase [Variovorax sp. SRS16]
MDALDILIIPGSARAGSLNRRLAAFAARSAGDAGLRVRELDLRALKLPLYDGDLEASSGVPEGAHELAQAIRESDGLLLVTPEYNGFPTPLVVNAFDWLSRIAATPSQPAGLAVTANKPVGLLSASPGPGGALRSMNFLRQYLQMAFAMLVVPQQFALSRAHEAFDEAGGLQDAKAARSVQTVLASLAALAQALKTAAR